MSDPPADLGELINKLQSSITSYEKEQDTAPGAFYTDRRYHSRNRPNRQYQGRQYSFNPSPGRQRKTCYVCKKEGCRSWKHSEHEQEESKARFRSRNLSKFTKFNTSAPNFEKRFDRAYRQYITEFEADSDKESDGDLGDTFEAMLMDDEPDKGSAITTFFTSVDDSTLTVASGVFLTELLANRSCIHQLTTETLIEPSEIEPQVADSLIAGGDTSRYNSDCFYGVIIDTSASKFSIARHA